VFSCAGDINLIVNIGVDGLAPLLICQTTVMTNVGNKTINLAGITVSGTSFSQTNTCGSRLGPHKSCNVVVTFAPESSGTFNGTVSISDNGGGSPQRVSLSGIGKLPTCGGRCINSCAPGMRVHVLPHMSTNGSQTSA